MDNRYFTRHITYRSGLNLPDEEIELSEEEFRSYYPEIYRLYSNQSKADIWQWSEVHFNYTVKWSVL